MKFVPHPCRFERVVQAATLALATVLFGLSLVLHPDPRGIGTHTQLGLPPCPKLTQTGLPCLTCGMTTAFAHAARGQFQSAFRSQPFGLLLFLGTVGAAGVSMQCLLRRRSWVPALRRLNPVACLAAGILLFALLLVAWGFKVSETSGRSLNEARPVHSSLHLN